MNGLAAAILVLAATICYLDCQSIVRHGVFFWSKDANGRKSKGTKVDALLNFLLGTLGLLVVAVNYFLKDSSLNELSLVLMGLFIILFFVLMIRQR